VLAAGGLCFIIGLATLLVGGAGTAYAYVTRDLPNPANLVNLPLAQVTQLYDRTGQHLLYEFYEERRIAVPLSDVAPIMIQATLAIEDPSFYQHKGFDLRGLLRAFLVDLQSGTTLQGGSTITQQLVKRTFLTDDKSLLRKFKELVLAVQVDSLYQKDQVLEMYLNQVYYGNQSYGVEAASLSYFGKHAKDLNLAEASLLAGLVQAPSQYDPVENPRAALRRQADVLDAMVRYNMIASDEAEDAKRQAAEFTYRQQRTDIVAPHFAFYVKEQLQQRVNPEVLRGGLKVITSLDLDMQTQAQQIVAKRVRQLRGLIVNNGALVAIDPKTGQILAMVGSADYYNKDIDGQVNVATALRQPGSSFKPITYATAFATKKWVPTTSVLDQPITRADPSAKNGLYKPQNYDEKFHGVVTLRTALANSYNIPALLVQEAVGTKEVIKTARSMGITTDLPEVQSLTLGAGSVRLLDMTSAYAVLANNGVRVEPTPFVKITDSHGKVVYDQGPPKGEQVISPEVAYLVTDVLSDPVARRPAFGASLDLDYGIVAAVKTGTTNDYRDSWTIGYAPSLVVGAWVGNTNNSPMAQVPGSLGAGYAWEEFMETELKGKPIERFTQPPTVTRGIVCGQRDVMIAGSIPTCTMGSIAVLLPTPTPRVTPTVPAPPTATTPTTPDTSS
jgi:1A family penicillin-binding protein